MSPAQYKAAWIKEQRRAIGAAHNACYTEEWMMSDKEVRLFLNAMEFALIFGWYLTE